MFPIGIVKFYVRDRSDGGDRLPQGNKAAECDRPFIPAIHFQQRFLSQLRFNSSRSQLSAQLL